MLYPSNAFRGDDRRLLKCQSELNASGLTLGELLKKKAESGVRVLIMIWGETTSIMGTHDTETENYFKGGGAISLEKICILSLLQPHGIP